MLDIDMYTPHSLADLVSSAWKLPAIRACQIHPSIVDNDSALDIEEKSGLFKPLSMIRIHSDFPPDTPVIKQLISSIGLPFYATMSVYGMDFGFFGESKQGIFGQGFLGRGAREVFLENNIYDFTRLVSYDQKKVFSTQDLPQPSLAYINRA